MFKIVTAAAVWLLASGLFSCKDEVIPPVPPKDPRTYTWVSDTIQYPDGNQTLMESVWGSSPTNVYIVGHNSATSAGTMFRWNGSSWTVPPFHQINGGPISGAAIVHDLLGFSANSIFFVGNLTNFGSDTGFVMEYNGSTWIQHTLPQNRPDNRFYTIEGLSRSDIWVGGGWNPFVFHFNGSTWTRDSLPIANQGHSIVIIAIGLRTSLDVWLTAYRYESTTGFITYYLLNRVSGQWTVMDSVYGTFPATEPSWGGHDYWRSPEGELYSAGKGIFKLVNGGWSKIMDTPFVVNDIHGSSARNFVVVGVDPTNHGRVSYSDGVSLYPIDVLDSSQFLYQGVWLNSTGCFVVGWDGSRSIAWRGN